MEIRQPPMQRALTRAASTYLARQMEFSGPGCLSDDATMLIPELTVAREEERGGGLEKHCCAEMLSIFNFKVSFSQGLRWLDFCSQISHIGSGFCSFT